MWKYFFLERNKKLRWVFSIVCGIYIVLFTAILEPLKNENYHYNYSTYYNLVAIAGYIILMIFLCVFIPSQFAIYFASQDWSLTKFMIWFAIFIIMGSLYGFVFDFYVYGFNYTPENIFHYFFTFQFGVDFFTALPILLFFFSSYPSDLLDKYFFIKPSGHSEPLTKDILYLYDHQKSKDWYIDVDSFYYVFSSDNCIELMVKNGKYGFEQLVVKSSLKEVEEQNHHLDILFRCHQAYIVNVKKIKYVQSNNNNYFLQLLDSIEEVIPVASNKKTDLADLIVRISNQEKV